MKNHRGIVIKMISILLLIIVTSISLSECAPGVTKSLAPIWLPDDPMNGNQHDTSGSWHSKSSDTTTHPDIKSDPPTIRHISSVPVEEGSYYPHDWTPGNLPFSILYVNRLARRRLALQSMANANNSQKAKRPTQPVTSTTKPATTRPAVRNRGQRQSKIEYSIIPELFMSYGWRGWTK